MSNKRSLIKIGLMALVILIFLAGGLVRLAPPKVAADDFPVREGTPLPPAPSEGHVSNQIIVKFKEGVLSIAEAQLNDTLRTTVVHTSHRGRFKVLKIPEGTTVGEMVNIYSKQSIVEYAEPNYTYRITWTPNDPFYSLQWHFAQINMPTAWDLDTTSPLYGGDPSIIVAVLDSGVAYENYGAYQQAPDLANTNFWTNPGETVGNSVDDDGNGYVDDIHGWDFVNNDAHPNDDNRHGTHVCGTIAQSTNNTVGVAGIAFNTTIMPIKGFNSAGYGTTASIADGIYYAADNGADIINMSFAGSSPSTTIENALAYAHNAGVVLIAAAGNEYQNGNPPQYPAAYDAYCIAVGATRYDQSRSYYSNTGSYLDIVAPGGDLTVDQNGDGYADGVLQQTFRDSGNVTTWAYYFLQGTSMATPHVAGVAALILAKHPTWTPAQVRYALESTATDKGTAGRDDTYGWGLINAYDAIQASVPSTWYVDDDGSNTNNGTAPGYAWRTITYAVSQVSNGDTIMVAAGNYNENVMVNKQVTIKGASSTNTTVTAANPNANVFSVAANYTTIRNLTITGATMEKGVCVPYQHHVTIRNCNITGNAIGIYVMGRTDNITIRYNAIWGNSSYGVENTVAGSWLNADRNWWGHRSGPDGVGRFDYGGQTQYTGLLPGFGDKVSTFVWCLPWLTRPVSTVQDDAIAYFGITTYANTGWNIVSTPLALDGYTMENNTAAHYPVNTWGGLINFGRVEAGGTKALEIDPNSNIFYWDSQNQTWGIVTIADNVTIRPIDCFYVKMLGDDAIPILWSPSLSVPAKYLYQKWNLVGFSYMPLGGPGRAGIETLLSTVLKTIETVSSAAGDVKGYAQVVSPPLNQYPWIYTAPPPGTSPASENWIVPEDCPAAKKGMMSVGRGYWVFMETPGTLAGLSFTPFTFRMED